jgi:hypothetical protein
MPPAEQVTAYQPKHPVSALTSYELWDYRQSLEHVLQTLPEHAAIRQQLQAKLGAVLAGQDAGGAQQAW